MLGHCFSFVPSLNDDVCEPSALKKILITVAALAYFKTNLLYLSFNKSIDILQMHLSMENMKLLYVGSINIDIYINILIFCPYLELFCIFSHIRLGEVMWPSDGDDEIVALFIIKVGHPCVTMFFPWFTISLVPFRKHVFTRERANSCVISHHRQVSLLLFLLSRSFSISFSRPDWPTN